MDHKLQSAIKATMIWLGLHSHLSKKEFEIELLWQLSRVTYDVHEYIHWRGFELGRLLFLSLAGSQNWRCCYCYKELEMRGKDSLSATIEHMKPKRLGGADHPDNLAIACNQCNSIRSIVLGTAEPF